MKGDIKWKSTNRQFYTTGSSVIETLQSGPGRGRMVGGPLKQFDRSSLTVVIAMSFFCLVILSAVDGLLALLWLVIVGPLGVTITIMIGQMGGVVWSRLVTTGYVALMLLGLGWAMAQHV